jgi:hypothetical protein
VTATVTEVAFPPDGEALPGPWAPNGEALLAYVRPMTTTEEPDLSGLRVWTVDGASGAPLWDSGDVEDVASVAPQLAEWAPDDSLVLPRAHDAWVWSDGSPAVAIAGIDGQPRRVDVAPDGATAFLDGVGGSWLVGALGDARQVGGRPEAGFAAWTWRDDSAALALAGNDGALYVLDVATGTVERLAEFVAGPPGAAVATPRWAADGTVLYAEALEVPSRGGVALDHRLVPVDGGQPRSVAAILGLIPNRDMPRDASAWLSRDGAWLLYPEIAEGDEAVAAVRWWLLDIRSGERRAAPAMADPLWSPTGVEVAHRADDGALAIWRLFDGRLEEVLPASAGVGSFWWSPSGRWLLAVDGRDGVWIAPADGTAAASRLAGPIDTELPPTWSPDEERLALALRGDSGAARLAILTLATTR